MTMTEQINVRTVWMEHSGGTKFYQIFEFQPLGGVNGTRPVTMTHWGSIAKLGAKEFHRPVNGGETQIKPGLGLNGREADKRKRGYTTENTRFQAHTSDSTWFVEHFGAAGAHELQVAMNIANVVPSDDVDTSYMGAKKAPEPTERPAGWGAW